MALPISAYYIFYCKLGVWSPRGAGCGAKEQGKIDLLQPFRFNKVQRCGAAEVVNLAATCLGIRFPGGDPGGIAMAKLQTLRRAGPCECVGEE